MSRADPVVASDGTTYERDAIQRLIDAGGISPCTKNALEPLLYRNLALLSRMDKHDEEMLKNAEKVVESERKRKRRCSRDEEKRKPTRKAVIIPVGGILLFMGRLPL